MTSRQASDIFSIICYSRKVYFLVRQWDWVKNTQ